MKLRTCLLLACTLTALLGCATQAPPPPTLSKGQQQEAIDHLKRFITQEMRNADTQGLSIAIVSDQAVVWEQGFGWANHEKQYPANAQTLYRAGSISKLLTDLGALQLAAAGNWNIDAPVRQVLPQFAPVAPDGQTYPITPRMLMTHHSGLPEMCSRASCPVNPSPSLRSSKQLNALGADDTPLRSFLLLQRRHQRIGCGHGPNHGQSFAPWMQNAVLQPLEMTHPRSSPVLAPTKRWLRATSKVNPPRNPDCAMCQQEG